MGTTLQSECNISFIRESIWIIDDLTDGCEHDKTIKPNITTE